MNLTVVMIGVLVLLAVGLVIYNILKIATAKQVKEYVFLHAMGAEAVRFIRLYICSFSSFAE